MNKSQLKTWILGKMVEMGCENTSEDRQEIKAEIDKMVSHEIAKIGICLDIPEGSEFWGIADNPKATPQKIADALSMPFREVSELQKETERFLNANKTI